MKKIDFKQIIFLSFHYGICPNPDFNDCRGHHMNELHNPARPNQGKSVKQMSYFQGRGRRSIVLRPFEVGGQKAELHMRLLRPTEKGRGSEGQISHDSGY